MNTLRLWVVFAIVAPDPIVPPSLMIMSAVMGLRGVCVRLFAQRSSLCVRRVCITAACLRPEVTHWCPCWSGAGITPSGGDAH